MIPERIHTIAHKIAERTHSADELQDVLVFLRTAPRQDAEEWLNTYQHLLGAMELPLVTDDFPIRFARNKPAEQPSTGRQRWWVAAAVIMLVATSVVFFLLSERTERNGVAESYTTFDKDPGKNGAVLTLADGSEVVLDSLGNGIIANQQGTEVLLRDGELAYNAAPNRNGDVPFNTIRTPKGRQFNLSLPDGTRVWLNAASSLRFPIQFNGKQRQVVVTGEAYFEVSHDPEKPFIVDVAGRSNVEVMGTHFNVNAFDNEAQMKTTLLEGSIRVSIAGNTNSVILKPGEQSQLSRETALQPQGINVVRPNLEDVMAWKNGAFNLEGASLKEVMKQLERWYDIEVVYEGKVPDVYFSGKMSRNAKLSSILKALEEWQIHFRLEAGNRLVVMQ